MTGCCRFSSLFLSTPSARRATGTYSRPTPLGTHFYPRPPRGGRRCGRSVCTMPGAFLSTPSARRATKEAIWAADGSRISIHALREEGDDRRRDGQAGRDISIHALREEGDLTLKARLLKIEAFLSTPSARRATLDANGYAIPGKFLSTPSARRATWCGPFSRRCSFLFLSTPSARRATAAILLSEKCLLHFYPRPPRGGRQQKQRQNLYFQTNYTTFCTNLEEP